MEGCVKSDHFIADDFAMLGGKVLKDGGDPFDGSGQTATGHATASGGNRLHARLRVDIAEQFAQISFRSLCTHA
jgi:hypothetical protein